MTTLSAAIAEDLDLAGFNPFGQPEDDPNAPIEAARADAELREVARTENATSRTTTATPTKETYSELQLAYDFFNQEIFEGRLPHCLITLQREKRSFGYFQDKTFVSRSGQTADEIAMNPRYFATRSIRETLSTLVHEMSHLWQEHFGTAKSRKGYHNKEWGNQMEKIGLMPSNTALPGGKKVGEKMSHFIIAGGLFDVACSKLLTQEFTLSWMDRHPAAPRTMPVPPDEAAAAGMQLPTPAEIAEVESAEKHITPPSIVEPKRRRTDGSNRVKYRCPQCSTQVWGKPELILLCGVVNCGGAKFEPIFSADVGDPHKLRLCPHKLRLRTP
jgi:predicted SprT family Zn-dependent metalloprotease